MIEFKPFFMENNVRTVYKWFEEDTFFYDSHLPTYISKKEIDDLLQYPESYVNIIYFNKKPIGLCDYIIEHKIAKIELQLSKIEIEINMEKILFDYCELLFENYPIEKISKYVYEFDNVSMELFEKSDFIREGNIYKYIYKDYKYWNVSVYSLMRNEFEDWRKKCLK